mmetsp:Transcript_33593/g.37536  ORF Transcript_33593/g.37536 Transcript_33593/m.37536 type:complete len:83 (+) Transcript_33593:163-411(+)
MAMGKCSFKKWCGNYSICAVLCCVLVVSVVSKLIRMKMKDCSVISSDLVVLVLVLVAVVVLVLETFEMESQKRSRRTISTTI